MVFPFGVTVALSRIVFTGLYLTQVCRRRE